MRSNTKQVRDLVKQHVLSQIDNDIEGLKANLKAVSYSSPTIYGQAKYLVDGGSFLVYNWDVKEFLDTLDINPNGKEYTDQASWDLYKHLVASEIEKLIK